MKRIGFLSFGHWRAAPGSQTRTASDALLQTIELAQAAEDLGVDGAFVRVHHFERQLASPFPLLAAIAARTSGSRGSRSHAACFRSPRTSTGCTSATRNTWTRSGLLEGVRSRFGRTYVGEPDAIAAELAADEAVREVDTVLFTVPNQLGVAYNARILATIASHIAPAIVDPGRCGGAPDVDCAVVVADASRSVWRRDHEH